MRKRVFVLLCLPFLTGIAALGQGSPVEKIRDKVFRIGPFEVDLVAREVKVDGVINKDVTTLEFVANTQNGAKAYESAITVMSDARTFNTALLMLALNPAHAVVPKKHFDPVAPKGDPVEIWVASKTGAPARRIRIEQLLYDQRTKKPLPEGPWVYTGSAFSNGKYMAEIDGVLIGFVHSPSPIIENPRAGAVNAYGSVELNKIAGFGPGTPITLIVKAVGALPGAKK
jgi:hypothetical protein